MPLHRGHRPALFLLLLAMAEALALGAGWWWMIRMPGRSLAGPLPPLTPAEADLARELAADVALLAGTIGERSLDRPAALAEAAAQIERTFTGLGLATRRQPYAVGGVPCVNVVAELPGTDRAAGLLVVGAHYDTVVGSPGANDNASGIAMLLALARRARSEPRPSRTLRFVAFASEEPPGFQTPAMGSLVAARGSREQQERVIGMLSLETLGYYRDEPGTQAYPFPLSLLYPDRGDFVAFVGELGSRQLVHRAIASFRAHTRFPSQGAALPGWIPGVTWSDHWSYAQVGYPAVMLTDTAPFRYPHYHRPTDTPDRLDYSRLARVTLGVHRLVWDLLRDGV